MFYFTRYRFSLVNTKGTDTVQAMMKRFPWFIGMGIMIVAISMIIGAVNGANAAATTPWIRSLARPALNWPRSG